MMTSSNGNISTLLAICAGNSPVHGEFPTQRPVTRGFDVYFDLRPNKRSSKQSLGWWFETLSPHYDVIVMNRINAGSKPHTMMPYAAITSILLPQNDPICGKGFYLTDYFLHDLATEQCSQNWQNWLNSYLPSAAYMRQWIGSGLVQMPLSEPMLGYCKLDP